MKTIYFVHDEQENPAPRVNILEMSGFQVRSFLGSRELFAALTESEPDLVVMDVLIDGKNGFQVAHELGARSPRPAFPVLLCSRIYRARQFEDEARRAGCSDYLLLPMSPDDFLQRVNLALAQFRPPEAAPDAAVA